MTKFNAKVENKVSNIAGGSAFKLDYKTELVHAVLSTFLEDKYYENGDARRDRIGGLVSAVGPVFAAKLAIIARKEFNLRSVSTLLLAQVAMKNPGLRDKNLNIKDAIVDATVRPDDLTEMAAYIKDNNRSLPKQVKRGIRNGLLKFDRYQLAKYKGEGKSVSLVDLFNLTHPKVKHASEHQREAWKDLIDGNLNSFDTWEVESSAAKTDVARKKVWIKLIKEDKLGYMALLRNLNNLIKYDVPSTTIRYAVEKLTDSGEVKESRQLPSRFMTAYDAVKGNRELTDTISIAMDHAVSNTPELSGNTLIGIDTSGSMEGDPIRKAAIFGATLAKANSRAEILLYSDTTKLLPISSRTPVIDIAKSIEKSAIGGGTNTSLVFDYATASKTKYDRIIIISDNESWVESPHNGGGSVQSRFKAYKNISKSDPFVYCIDIQGYGTKDISAPKVYHLTGWSDRLLDFVGRVEQGESLIKYIENYQIPISGAKAIK